VVCSFSCCSILYCVVYVLFNFVLCDFRAVQFCSAWFSCCSILYCVVFVLFIEQHVFFVCCTEHHCHPECSVCGIEGSHKRSPHSPDGVLRLHCVPLRMTESVDARGGSLYPWGPSSYRRRKPYFGFAYAQDDKKG
jgi:hypothetical protein